MKYAFLAILSWVIGFLLPYFAVAMQWAVAVLAVCCIVVCVYYYIDTRINAIRL